MWLIGMKVLTPPPLSFAEENKSKKRAGGWARNAPSVCGASALKDMAVLSGIEGSFSPTIAPVNCGTPD
jgi:hypothetical protein